MSVENGQLQQPQGSAIGHVLKRLFLALFGYLIALLIGLIAIVVIYSVLIYLPGSPDYFKDMAVTPIALLLLPPLWVLYILVAFGCTIIPAIIVMLASEALSLRRAWLHMLFGALTSLFGYVLLAPQTEDVQTGPALPDLVIILGAGLVGGFVYWLVAGRDAGFRRRV